jgi:hypothetical protein
MIEAWRLPWVTGAPPIGGFPHLDSPATRIPSADWLSYLGFMLTTGYAR